VGRGGAEKARKSRLLVDAMGLPVAVGTRAVSTHVSKGVQPLFEFMLMRELPERVIGDRAFDGEPLDLQLEEMGIELIAPHRKNRRPEHKTPERSTAAAMGASLHG